MSLKYIQCLGVEFSTCGNDRGKGGWSRDNTKIGLKRLETFHQKGLHHISQESFVCFQYSGKSGQGKIEATRLSSSPNNPCSFLISTLLQHLFKQIFN